MKKKFSIALVIGIVILVTGASCWYFGIYKPKKELQKSEETFVLSMAGIMYKIAFVSDEDLFKRCQKMKVSTRKDGAFTLDEIIKHDYACKCAVDSAKRSLIQLVIENYEMTDIGVFEKVKTGAENLKKGSDIMIEMFVDGCKIEQEFQQMEALEKRYGKPDIK